MDKFPSKTVSKQPGSSTSIFAVMSQLAGEYNAINLSQGFPDFDISRKLIDLVHHFMLKGFNQYAPMPGVPVLRRNIATMVKASHGASYDPDREITITAGATQALFTAITALIHPGDEVIIFEPAYDSYAPAVRLNGGVPRFSRLKLPDYQIDWETLPSLISEKTRMIIINSPHNPTGSVLKPDDLLRLEQLADRHDLIVLSDEVYEHLIFDGIAHESVCRYPGLARRSLMVGSFGKTFHTTGWKMGFVLAPEALTAELRKVHQWVVFAVNTPVQHAVASFLEDEENYRSLSAFYQAKRDHLVKLLQGSRFQIIPSYGTYFQLLDYSDISDEKEMDFAVRMTKEYGLATVPVSPFYHAEVNNRTLRVCFAKKEETLDKAAEILCRI